MSMWDKGGERGRGWSRRTSIRKWTQSGRGFMRNDQIKAIWVIGIQHS